MRARNGHPEPYAVKYWEIGNEIWGDWVRGHSDAAHLRAQLHPVRRSDARGRPSIKLIAVGDNDMAWNRAVLRGRGRVIDYLAHSPLLQPRDMAAIRAT